MNSPARALRLGRLLAVLAVWAGVLGYVIPAAFSARPSVSATAAAVASPSSRIGRIANQAGRRPSPEPQRLSQRPGNAMVRVIQASLRAHRVTVTVDGQALSHDLLFASVTPYRAVRPGTWIVRAVSAREHATARVTLAAGSTSTLVVLDARGHLAIRAQQDSVSIKATARDAAGLGGTTPRSGWSPVAWVAPAATALLLGLAWLSRLRQFRWARRAAARIR
jgi:hypothetical protein